jgi:hypothetical protein
VKHTPEKTVMWTERTEFDRGLKFVDDDERSVAVHNSEERLLGPEK